MAYKKVGWKNYPSTDTPINATNLDHMDAGILENAQTIGDKTKISGIGDGTVTGAIAANQAAITANTAAIEQNTQSLTINNVNFNLDYQNGKYGWNESSERGADTFHPFTNLANLLWTNENPTNGFKPQTISLDLTNYEYVLIECNTSTKYFKPGYTLIKITETEPTDWIRLASGWNDRTSYLSFTRFAWASPIGVNFSTGFMTAGANTTAIIPVRIYGINVDI